MKSLLIILLLVTALTSVAADSTNASVFYSKHFPGSTPEWVAVQLHRSGEATYKEAPDDPEAVTFKLAASETDEIFALVDKLDRFRKQVESGLKVAKMGEKTFRYEDGAERNEVKFNYSLDENARLLHDAFERITESQQLLFLLERTVRFDRLGVNKSLLQFEQAMDRKRIVTPERFLPMLDRVARNDGYLHMARERAAALADAIRNPKPKTPAE